MSRSFVVTGGGRGIGRAVVERLLGADDTVVALELDRAALEWTEARPEVLAAFDSWLDRLGTAHGFAVTGHAVEVTGICADCKAA